MTSQTSKREKSVFYPVSLVKKARDNIKKYPWAAEIQRQAVEAAKPWMALSDDELWDLMFGHTIKRSWMVWSNGHCPACHNGVPMYSWQIAALKLPWKVRCPHCSEIFPKNDFHAFYRSGLDEHGIFDTQCADRTLLFNVEHPDPNDPLHRFGVDDGEAFVEGDKRWWFIGTYLIYGQWKQLVVDGIRNLSTAYLLTGDTAYAHKAGVLLDRVADVYPTFDFKTEGVMYEGPAHAGYVSTWHDACEETRELALAYDQVREALQNDEELVTFLAEKAVGTHDGSPLNDNPKTSFDDIRRNIEDRILSDALENAWKIHSNYPRTEIAIATLKTVLGWPENREEVYTRLDSVLEQASAVDGVTGEKGLAGYSSFTIQGVAMLLSFYARLEPDFLRNVLNRHPRIHQMFRFHIDTWCLQQYYPLVGDTGGFAGKMEQYVGVAFSKGQAVGSSVFTFNLSPSMFTFLWQLYELTGDVAFVQVLYRANGNSVEGLPYDLFADDPTTFRKVVQDVIDREGSDLKLVSVNKEQWHLAILRSGEGKNARATWLSYDSGGGHSHANGMNMGLFAKGLDLMPDFGYPPVHYGGWSGPRFDWYLSSAAHNTVVVDGRNHQRGVRPGLCAGKTTFWKVSENFQVIRVSGPELIEGKQFERTVAMIDISDRDFYILDIFRVVGGTDHAKFMHSHYGQITTNGLNLAAAEDYGFGTQMRNFNGDTTPQPGWSVDWKIEDRFQYLSPEADIHLRYTDLTSEAQAFTAEGWIAISGFRPYEDAWIPRIMVRRVKGDGDTPLQSTFVGIIEPYEKTSNIANIRRLPLVTADGVAYPDSNVAIEIQLIDGRRDLIISADMENPLGLIPSRAANNVLVQKEWDVHLDGEICFVRKDNSGVVERMYTDFGSTKTGM